MKTVSQSRVENNIIIQPGDLNIHGTLFGGRLVSLIDEIAAIAGVLHADLPLVTLSMDEIVFEKPVHLGHIITLKAMVNRVFNSSMEVGVRVYSYDVLTKTTYTVCKAFLTFVAIDDNNNTVNLPPIKAESDSEMRHYENAGIRREHRIELREKLHSI